MFGPRKVTRAELDLELEQLRSSLRALTLEQQQMHDQVRRWMRRAVAAERRLDEGAESGASAGTEAAPVTPAPPSRRLWGARARRLARPAPDLVNGEDTDGLHS